MEAGGKILTERPYGAKYLVVGYRVVEGRDLAHAVDLSSACPIFATGGIVEVPPLTRM